MQKETFLSGEGDAYFQRNPVNMREQIEDPWNLRLADFVADGDRVLEIGCADGRRLAAIRELSDCAGNFWGVDPSTKAVTAGNHQFKGLELRVGTADQTGLEGQFNLILIGFCLYLCDRQSLFTAIAEVDRLLLDGGILAIIDFDPPFPIKRPYHHVEGLWSFKMDYSSMFLASPAYNLVEKHTHNSFVRSDTRTSSLAGDRVSLWILQKNDNDSYFADAG